LKKTTLKTKLAFLFSLTLGLSLSFWPEFASSFKSSSNEEYLSYLKLNSNLDSFAKNLPASSRLALGQKINLNNATAEDLKLLPGIGQKMAEEILKVRSKRGKFSSLEEMMSVKGIKEKRFSRLKPYLEI